jgi:hypothetical protein
MLERLVNARLASDARGAVSLELCVALLPVLMLSVWVWQSLELRSAELVVRRAAEAAARAAAVVLPDDPAFYGGERVGVDAGARRAEIERAAALVLLSSPGFQSVPRVELSHRGDGALGARVSARFDTGLGTWRAGSRMLVASATAADQSARYGYGAEGTGHVHVE